MSPIVSCHQLLDSGMKYILDVKNGLRHFISSAPVLVDAVPLIASAMSFGTSVSHGVHELGENHVFRVEEHFMSMDFYLKKRLAANIVNDRFHCSLSSLR